MIFCGPVWTQYVSPPAWFSESSTVMSASGMRAQDAFPPALSLKIRCGTGNEESALSREVPADWHGNLSTIRRRICLPHLVE